MPSICEFVRPDNINLIKNNSQRYFISLEIEIEIKINIEIKIKIKI
jgi:hypothetical protein